MAEIAETFIVLYAVYNIWVLYDVRRILYTMNIVLTQGRISAISAISAGHKTNNYLRDQKYRICGISFFHQQIQF